MKIYFKYVAFVLIAVSINTYSQVYESIEEIAAQYFISLSNKDSDAENNLSKLKELLYRNYDKAELGSKYQISINDFDSLKKHFNEYEITIKNLSPDSALVLFNGWYLHFQNSFYDYSKQKFFTSNKMKILFFGTSMSCYCTLKMSREQTVELLKFIIENGEKYDCWVIDSYWHNELQIDYMTLFAPSVIVFSGDNEVLYKIEYEEKMLEILLAYLNGKVDSKG